MHLRFFGHQARPHFKLSWIISIVLLGVTHVTLGAIDSVQSSDCTACDGSAYLETTMAGLVTFEWYSDNGNLLAIDQNNLGSSSVSNLCPGLYQVQYNNGNDVAIEWFSIDYTEASAGQPGFLQVCSATGNYSLFTQLNGTPIAGGQWYDPLGVLHTGVFNSNAGVAGFYQYVIDDGGCLLVSGVEVTLTENADPGLSATYLICETYNPFFLTDVLAGQPDNGGVWFNANQDQIDGFYDPEVDETSLFTYMIDTVPGCPPVYSTLYVIENQLPDPGLDTDITVCLGALPFDMTSVLEGTPVLSGTWYNESNDTVSAVFDPLLMPSGLYNYVVQATAPCPAQESILNIELTDDISAGISSSIELCISAAPIDLGSQLGGAPTIGGIWSNPEGVEVSSILNPAQALPGDYSYSVQAMGCESESSILHVSFEQQPVAGPSTEITFCENGSPVVPANLLDPVADADGVWMIGNEEIIGDLEVEGGNSYELAYIVEGGVCPDGVATYTVVVDQLPSAGPPVSLELCATDPALDLADYVNPDIGFELLWFDPEASVVDSYINPSIALSGDYTLMVLSGNTCPDDQVTIGLDIATPAFVNAFLDQQNCVGTEGLDLDDFLPSEIPSEGTWTYNGVDVFSPLVASEAQSGIYLYTYANAPACASSVVELNLTLGAPFSAGVGEPLWLCSNEPGVDLQMQLSDAYIGGQWLFNGVNLASSILDPSTADSGIYQYVVPAVGPCPADTSEVMVEVHEAPSFSAGPDVSLCAGDEGVAIGSVPCEGCIYQWSNTELLNDPSSATPLIFPPQTAEVQNYIIGVLVSDGVCSVEDELVVNVFPLPVIEINAPSSLCANEQILIELQGGDSYSWQVNPGDLSGQDSVIEISAEQDLFISVIGASSEGCLAYAEEEIEVLLLPEVEFNLEPVAGCAPFGLTLQLPDADAELLWLEFDGDEIFEDDYVLLINEPGFYDISLHAVSFDGCELQIPVASFIEVYPTPVASFEIPFHSTDILNTQVEFLNTSMDADEYVWTFGNIDTSSEDSPVFTFPAIADQGYEICLTASTDVGCIDQYCEDLFVEDELLIYVPNAFTPDGDGLNEVFKPITSGIDLDEFRFMIYDRWGTLIFVSHDVEQGWIGNVFGGDHYAQNGVYTWVIETRGRNSADLHRITGQVTLLR